MSDQVEQRLTAALSNSYELQRELGGGGMSRVFLATDRQLGRDVVIKTLPSELMSPDAGERFKREIRTAARLQHPNIVPLLSAGDADGIPWYTMPWVDGASLRERLQRDRVPVFETIGILRDIARALAAAHAKGVVHRDIKPENILLTSGAALVTDFGVARALSHAAEAGVAFRTGTGISVGTPAYMAPEQFAADPEVDHRADLYSWGIVAYELLTGHHPFEGTTGTALLKAHMGTTPAVVSAPGLSPAISSMIARTLEKDPARRPASAQEVLDALDAASRGTPQPPARTRRRILAIIVVAMSAAVVAIATLMSARARSNSSHDARMIAVAPFRVGGATADVHYLREGLGDLMTPQLLSIPGISAPSMRVMLEQWRRAGGGGSGTADADLTDERALRVAGNTGASQLILGTITGAANHLTVSANLIRVSDGKVLAPASVEGPADSAAAIAARLLATLLSLRNGSTEEEVRSVVSANPQAITPFLTGEHAYRRGLYHQAAVAFATAYEHDTTFALAALHVDLANAWLVGDAVVPGPWFERTWAQRGRLRGGDAALVRALGGPAYPAPQPAREYERGLWAAAEKTPSAELWYHSGDVLAHRYMLGGDTSAMSRALLAFQRAEALDSSFAPALEHQSSIFEMMGDSARARAAFNRQRMLDSTGDFFLVNVPLFSAAHGSLSDAERLVRKYAHTVAFPLPLLRNTAISDIPSGIPDDRRLPLAEAYMEAIKDRGLPLASNGLLSVEAGTYGVNTGRPASFRAGPGKDSALLVNVLNVFMGVADDGDSLAADRSARELARWASTIRDTLASTLIADGYFADGLWALNHGDSARVERARWSLRKLGSPPATPWLLMTPRILEKVLGAGAAVSHKSPDARQRLEELDLLLIDAPVDWPFVLSISNVVVSGLWERLGDDKRAWLAIERRHIGPGMSLFVSARLRARARIAERLGRRRDAVAALRTYVAIRGNADAQHQADLRAARVTLAKLERRPSGR